MRQRLERHCHTAAQAVPTAQILKLILCVKYVHIKLIDGRTRRSQHGTQFHWTPRVSRECVCTEHAQNPDPCRQQSSRCPWAAPIPAGGHQWPLPVLCATLEAPWWSQQALRCGTHALTGHPERPPGHRPSQHFQVATTCHAHTSTCLHTGHSTQPPPRTPAALFSQVSVAADSGRRGPGGTSFWLIWPQTLQCLTHLSEEDCHTLSSLGSRAEGPVAGRVQL